MIEAWCQASDELGIKVVSPYTVHLPNGTDMQFEVYLPDFGCPKGALLLPIEDSDRAAIGKGLGYFMSQLSVESYGTYKRQFFIDTLNDFQWYSCSKPPSWYTGQPWT